MLSSPIRLGRTLLKLVSALIILLIASQLHGNPADIHAQGVDDSVMTVEILDLPEYPPSTIAVGEQFTFRIRYSCGAVTGGNCDNFSIELSLPDWFDISSAILETGAPYAAFTTVTGGGILTITLLDVDPTPAAASRLDPGESETATITLRPRDDAYDFSANIPPAPDVETVTTTITSDATTEVIPPDTDIALESPDLQWSINKVRVLPPLSVIPALDQPVIYRICLSSDSNVDNYVLNDFTITDTIPPGAEVLSPAEGGAVSYTPTGTSFPTTVTWTYSDVNISFRSGSVCHNIALRYPSTTFTLLSSVDNIAESTLTTISGQPCLADCTDSDNELHGFGVEVATPATSKTIVQNPVGIFGIGRWRLSLNTQLSNAPTDLLEFIDEMPVDNDGVLPGPGTPDYLPLQVTQIIPGGWSSVSVGDSSIDVRAHVETSETTTCKTAPAGATWTTLSGSPFDGATTSAVELTPPSNNIRCMRTTFEQNDGSGWIPGAPMNFNIGSPFQIIFEVRDPATTGADYVGATLENCMYTESSVAGGPNDATIDSATNCATVDIAGPDDNVSINFRKTMPANPEPEDYITISLITDLTERASADLIDPIIADAIPSNIYIDTAADYWNISYIGDFSGDTTLSENDINNNVGGSSVSVSMKSITGTPEGMRDVITFDLSGLSVAPPPIGTKRIQIDIFGQIRPFTVSTEGAAPPYYNLAYFVETGPGNLVCEQTASTGNNGTVVDVDDVFGISATDICQITRTYDVPRTARFAGQKWLRNEDDPTNIVLAPGLSGTCEDATVVTDGQVTESNYTRNPCVHEGDVGDIFTYRLTLQNTGNISLFDYHLYDLLPYEGDTGVNLVTSPRGSNWRPIMTSTGVEFSDSGLMTDAPLNTLLTAGDFVFEYSDSRIPCRPEVGISTSCDTVTWSTDPANDFANGWSSVESFRIVLDPGTAWEPGVQVEFLVTMEIPAIEFYDTFTFSPIAGTTNPSAGLDTTQNPEVGHVAWNNFAHNFYEYDSGQDPDDLLSVAEPPRVGILIPEFGSIGNIVFFDNDNNRQYEPASGETGVENVIVELYADTNGNSVFDGPDTLVTTTTTGNPQITDSGADPGYYLFDNLAEGDYFVHLPASNFIFTGPLYTYTSSIDTIPVLDSFINNIDHGVDNVNLTTDGITSPMININFDNELISDDGPGNISSDVADGPYRRGNQHEENNSSDLTVDFGFFIPMSIGNQVWFDPNNNALIDGGESGINGVLVELFRDGGSGIDLINDSPYRTTTTNANGVTSDGYYIFDGLPEGDYRIRLAPSNFNPGGVLIDGNGDPYSSSESGGVVESVYLVDNQTDDNDNGIDENFPQTNGIASNIITLSHYQEPDGDTIPAEDVNPAPDDTNLDLDGSAGPSGEGTNGERDDNAEMTVDFGVYSPIMSIGNRVFKDYDNNRILDGADVGMDGVEVNLFLDSDQNGIPDSGINNPIATTTTAGGGYYLFDGLLSGYYLVQIDEVNFRTTGNGTLRDYYSSQDKASFDDAVGVPPTDNENDTIEDGVDNPFNLAQNPDPQAEGVFSPTIHLQPSNEPWTEADLGPEGDGEPNIQASNSDLTVDFGFYQPMSLGNVIWFDTNNDGLLNGAEAGIAGVQVELYRETDGTPSALDPAADTLVPVYDGTNYVNFDTTDSNGFYLFDNLPAGQYWVHIPAANFNSGNVLFNHLSTTPNNVPNPSIAPAPDTDSNDNGTPDDATAATLGVTSEIITLGVIDPVNGSGLYIPDNSEHINEINKSNNPPIPSNTYDGPVSIGRYGELDDNSDITIDFGFILGDTASMSIGNRVWFDTNRNGLIDSAGDDNPLAPGNPGIDGVTVLLYRADIIGNPIGNPIARDITANGGYYLFDVLDTDAATAVGDGDGLGGPVTPGNYVVSIPNSNFLGGGALETYISTDTSIENDGTLPPSTGVESGYSAIDDDNNDNGTENATYGVLSDLISLVLQNERDDEDFTNKETGVLDGRDASASPIAFNNSDLTVDFGFYLPMSIGNFVWVDINNNGVYDTASEYAVPDGVILELYQSDGTTPIPDPDVPAITYQDVTVDGFYLFDELPPGDYVVRVVQLNFVPGGLLEGYLGSDNGSTYEDDTDADLNDNGRDIPTPATSGGIPSGIITLTYNTEPLLEATSGNPADGPAGRGNNGELDANSNLTVDFGVYPTTYFSIGNRVWIDTGAGANEGNGVHDSDELGIENVIMYLFRDENDGAGGGPDGIPDSTTPFASTTTDVDGYYLFDSLASGNYIVSVAPNNLQFGGVLRGYSVTLQTDAAESLTDNLSDQVNTSPDIAFGYYSATYTLGPGASEPTGESDPTPAGATQNPGIDPFSIPIPDDQSNLTVDFGFLPSLSLGNLVWFDLDNDGLYDVGSELGIAGVTVELYIDDGNGTFEGTETLINTDITDGNGYYLFNDLQPGNYFLHIPNTPNWNNGGGPTPLAGLMSSGPDAPVPDSSDNNDNGSGTSDTNPIPGVTSQLLTLAFGTAPTGESTLSNNPADGPEFRGTSNPTDNNSDLTWDFGFYQTDVMSIGNIVWIDDGNTTGTANDGIRNGDELGVNGVIVDLYSDTDGNGVPDTSTPLETTITANGGYYLFDGLPPGQYVVVISENNFDSGLLYGYLSTQDGTPDNDDQDNGDNNPTPWSGGVRSSTIILAVGTEPSPSNPPDDSEAVTGTGVNGETDDNSNLTVDFGFIAAYDWGDAPDSYGTDNDTGTTTIPIGDSDQVGPNHRIVANLYLGSFVDDETNGVPVPDGTSNNTFDVDGDGADGGFDEDGLGTPVFVAGTTETVDITVFNNTGTAANLVAWFDWNGNGVFDASEGYTATVPDGTDGIIQINVSVPVNAEDLTGGYTYARLRLTTDSITTSEPTGSKDDGEVEDYYIRVQDVNLLINKTDGLNAIMAGVVNTYTITIENSGVERTGVRFYDDIPLATSTDANGYDPETIEWTCAAVNGASCIANAVSGTGSSGGPYAANATSVIIDELIDLPRNGRITYTINARVNEDAGQVPLGNSNPIRNVAQLPNESPPLEDEDLTSVIFDPPFGIKVGTYRGFNIIRWTMAWYNPGATQTNVTITDVLPANQQFPATTAGINLQCSGSIGSCYILGDNTVVWTGTMLSSTPDNDANAILIQFNTLVAGEGTYNNSATLSYGGEEVTASGTVIIDFSILPETGFAPNEITDLGNIQPVLYTETGGYRVEIPSLDVNIPIVGVPLVDGLWDVSWLGNQAGWLEGSAFPSWSGNSVLTSHVYGANGLPGPFIKLNQLRYGDKVFIHIDEQIYRYEVQTNTVVEPNDLSIFEHEELDWLTLVTCKEYDEKSNTYGKRVVIRAVLVDVMR